MIKKDGNKLILKGPKGTITLNGPDEITEKFCMLYEGQCNGLGAAKASKKYGYSRQRYYQILDGYKKRGAETLKSKKTGPQTNYRKTGELVRQVIRHRFLDHDASAEVIKQKLVQCGFVISVRSVERVINQFGLSKKNSISITPKKTL